MLDGIARARQRPPHSPASAGGMPHRPLLLPAPSGSGAGGEGLPAPSESGGGGEGEPGIAPLHKAQRNRYPIADEGKRAVSPGPCAKAEIIVPRALLPRLLRSCTMPAVELAIAQFAGIYVRTCHYRSALGAYC